MSTNFPLYSPLGFPVLVVLVVKFLQLRFTECTLDYRLTPEAPSLSGCSKIIHANADVIVYIFAQY